MAVIRFGNKTYRLPGSRIVRFALGVFLIAGGILGFLPILGFWMVPLGLLILSADSARIRRLEVWWGKRKRGRVQVDLDKD